MFPPPPFFFSTPSPTERRASVQGQITTSGLSVLYKSAAFSHGLQLVRQAARHRAPDSCHLNPHTPEIVLNRYSEDGSEDPIKLIDYFFVVVLFNLVS